MKHSSPISYSAPAKVILSGEHAVVYGKPALVSALDLRLTFSLWKDFKPIKDTVINHIAKTVRNYLAKQKIAIEETPFNFSIRSAVLRRGGLGSSAALAVAATAAFLEFYTSREFDKEVVNNISYKIEKYFHTNPSGVDNTTSCFGGLVFFRREFEFLKTISLLNFKIPQKIEPHLYLIDSGKPMEKTKDMVSYVGTVFNRRPKIVDEIFCNIEKVTKRITISLIKEDSSYFRQAILENHRFLDNLGVVSEKTKKILTDLKNYGVGKITGAGGRKVGSGLILFFADQPDDFESYLKNRAVSFIKFKQSSVGLKKE